MRGSFLCAACALAVLACGSPAKPRFDHLTYSEVSLAPIAPQLEPNRVTISEGIVVKARVRAIDRDGEPMSGRVSLRPENSGVLDVAPGPEGTLVFVGVADGQTMIEVSLGGRAVGRVEGLVVPQSN
jgi:hypothetical protein